MLTIDNDETLLSPEHDTPVASFAFVFFCNKNTDQIQGVTKHPIKNNLITQGHYVDPNTVKDILTQKSSSQLDLIPDNILAQNDKYLVWYTPAKLQTMWFRIGKKQTPYKVIWTPLLFIADKKNISLKVFALATNKRPTLNTKIYHAPLMNISNNGTVCQGTATLSKNINSTTLQDVENTIFDSNFTHVNHSNTLNLKNKKTISTAEQLKFWQKKAQSKTKISPQNLVFYKTFNELLATLT